MPGTAFFLLHLFIICVYTLYVWGQSCHGAHTSQELVGRGSWVQKGLAVKSLYSLNLTISPAANFWKLPHCEACKNTPCKTNSYYSTNSAQRRLSTHLRPHGLQRHLSWKTNTCASTLNLRRVQKREGRDHHQLCHSRHIVFISRSPGLA